MRTDRQIDQQADVMKLIAAFRNFANEPTREAVQECVTVKHGTFFWVTEPNTLKARSVA